MGSIRKTTGRGSRRKRRSGRHPWFTGPSDDSPQVPGESVVGSLNWKETHRSDSPGRESLRNWSLQKLRMGTGLCLGTGRRLEHLIKNKEIVLLGEGGRDQQSRHFHPAITTLPPCHWVMGTLPGPGPHIVHESVGLENKGGRWRGSLLTGSIRSRTSLVSPVY